MGLLAAVLLEVGVFPTIVGSLAVKVMSVKVFGGDLCGFVHNYTRESRVGHATTCREIPGKSLLSDHSSELNWFFFPGSSTYTYIVQYMVSICLLFNFEE